MLYIHINQLVKMFNQVKYGVIIRAVSC